MEAYNSNEANLIEFIKSPDFIISSSEEQILPAFTTTAYQKLVLPQTKEVYQELYLAILDEINNKIKEISFANSFYESTGMITITDTNFINNLLYTEQKANSNLMDINRYETDLLILRNNYLKKFHRSLLNDLNINPIHLAIEYYSNLDYYLVFSSQIINVSAHEILDLLKQNDSSLNIKVENLLSLINAVKRMMNERISYEVTNNNLDPTTIEEFLYQNNDLLATIKSKYSLSYLSPDFI